MVDKITYPGTNQKSVFSYDPLGRCVEIDEYTGSGTASSQEAFVWCGNERCETRDAASSYALLNQFFSYGETISGTSYCFTKDHLGSVREMTNASGTIVWQQSFDPYGVATTIVSTTPADMGYAGYYVHQRSGLNLTATRAYSASLGRFINRDPIGELEGTNLYRYCLNNPNGYRDPLGTQEATVTGAVLGGPPGALAGLIVDVAIDVGIGTAVAGAVGAAGAAGVNAINNPMGNSNAMGSNRPIPTDMNSPLGQAYGKALAAGKPGSQDFCRQLQKEYDDARKAGDPCLSNQIKALGKKFGCRPSSQRD